LHSSFGLSTVLPAISFETWVVTNLDSWPI
jgi:hypothetical protein